MMVAADTRANLARMAPGLAAAAIAAEGSCLTGSVSMTAAAFAAAVAAGGGVLGLSWRNLGRPGRLYGAATAAYAAVWAAAISMHGGPFWHGDGWLLAGAALLAAPWAYRHRWQWDSSPTPEPVPVRPDQISEFQQIWHDYALQPNSVFEDCQLTPEWEIPGGRQADIVAPRGRKSTEDLLAGIRLLRSAWDTDPTKLFLEPTPDGKSTKARLTVLERDVLADGPVWKGPTLDPATGIVVIGEYPDAQLTHGQFWAPRSGATDFFVGGTKGSGKSAFLEKLACELHLTPLAVGWVSDPQEGQCLPDFIDTVDRYAIGGGDNVEANIKMLRAMRRIVFRRSRFFGQEIEWVDAKGRERKGGKKYFDPNETDVHGVRIPLLYAFLDEVHALVQNATYGKEALRLLADISRLDRKTGVGKAYVAHSPSLTEMGGHQSAIIRNLLKEGTIIAFRTGESVAQHMLGLSSDPSKLPARFADGSKTHGLGLIAGGPDGRSTQFRAEYNDDTYEVASKRPAGVLDAMSAEAAAMPDDAELAPKTFVVPGFPRVSLIPTAQERQTWADRILQMLADGADHSFGAIFKALPEGTSDRSVRHGLKQLVEQGHAQTAGPKQPYRITDAGRAELDRRGVAA